MNSLYYDDDIGFFKGLQLEFAKNNKKYMEKLLKKDNNTIIYAGKFRDDKDFMLEACRIDVDNIRHIGDNLATDKDFMKDLFNNDNCFDLIETIDRSSISSYVKKGTLIGALEFLRSTDFEKKYNIDNLLQDASSSRHRDDVISFLKDALEDDIKLDGNIIDDKTTLISLIREGGKYGRALEYASDELLNNKEVALEAFIQNPDFLKIMKDDIKSDVSFLKNLVLAKKEQRLKSFKEDNCLEFFDSKEDFLKNGVYKFELVVDRLEQEDFKNQNIVNALIKNFSKYECSDCFNLEELSKHPNDFFEILKTYNFKNEKLKVEQEFKNDISL